MRRSPILALLVLVVVLSATATALGQRGTESYVTVVGPDAQGVRLDVRARPGGVCARVRLSAAISENDGCTDLPRIDLLSPFTLNVVAPTPSGAEAIGGAVRSGVARVEYVLPDGQRFGADTVAAPQLGGRLARALRYFLLELPAGDEPVTRRLLDASGRVVDEQDGLFEFGSAEGPPPLKGPVRLAHGRRDGAPWSVYAVLRNQLDPVRGDAGRRVPAVCTDSSRASQDASACAHASQPGFTFGIEPGCLGRRAALLHGIAGPGVRVELRLGDRRLHPARMVALPPGYAQAGARAWVFPVPFEAAVQSVRAIAAGGRLLHEVTLRREPPQLTCATGDFGVFLLAGGDPQPVFTSPPVVLQPGGGPPLTLRDAEDAELCVSVGPAQAERTCIAPAPQVISAVMASSRGESVAGGAVDPAVAAIVATASDGSRRRVATDPGAAYTGRYAGLVRFFSVAAPRGAHLVSLSLLDARGRRLFEWPLAFDFKPDGPQRRILTGRSPGGRFDLVEARFSFLPIADESVSCLSLVRHGERVRDLLEDCMTGPGEHGHLSTREASGKVRCDLRAAVIVGGAPRAASAVRMRLSDGSTRAGRLFASPLGRAFLVVPPSRRGLRRIEIADRSGRVLRTFGTRLPPAARQCGYDFELSSQEEERSGPARAARLVRAAVPAGVSQPYAASLPVRLTALPWQRR